MPTPSYAAPHTASPGTRATSARIRATRSRWPTAYCGSPPPQRCTCVSTGRAGEAGRLAEVAQRRCDELLVGHLEHRLLAVPADRGAQHAGVPSPAARTQSHLLKEKVGGLDRPAVDGRYEEAGAGEGRQVGLAERQGHHRHRGVLDAASSAPPTGASVCEQASGRRGGGRRARPRRRAPPRPRSSGRPRGRSRRACGAARAPSRPVRTSSPAASATGQPAEPARRSPANTGPSGGAASAAAADATSDAAAPRHQLRHGRPGREVACVAGVHAAEQRLDQPVDDLVAEPGRDQLADGDVLAVGERGDPAVSSRSRASPASLRTPDAATCVDVGGHAHHRPRQRPQRSPGPDGRRGRRGVDDVEPELAREVDAFRPPSQHRLGADVHGDAGRPRR